MLEDDYFWATPRDQRVNVHEEPTSFTIGQLSESGSNLDIDFRRAGAGISRDVQEATAAGVGWIALFATAALPVVAAIALSRRRWVAVIPLALSAGLAALWVAYYATTWIGPLSQAAWMPVAVVVAIGWLVLVVDAMWRRSRFVRESFNLVEIVAALRRPDGHAPR